MNPVKSLRIRYLFGLGFLAVLVASTYLVMVNAIERQQHYGRVIHYAGEQIGLVNRIAFFVQVMATTEDEDDFDLARAQIGRAINLMRKRHDMLVHGAPEQDFPKVSNATLKQIYFDSGFGLDMAIERFMKRAELARSAPWGTLNESNAAYVYVVTYGPFVLETLQNAAVTEYEDFARSEMTKLKYLELGAVVVALLVMCLEAFLIFRPLERRIHSMFHAVELQRNALARERDRAERASQSKSHFLTNMSHELRTPLNAIIGFSSAILDGIYGPIASKKQEERINDIHSSGIHLQRLVNDILDISALEAGAIDMNEGEIEATALVQYCLGVVQADKNFVDAAIDVRNSGPNFIIHGDVRRLNQILLNLLSNAFKYTSRPGKVGIERLILPSGEAGFRVSDTGPGMSKEEVSLAQERFGRVGNALVNDHTSIGLGLPVTVELVKVHEGAIKIDSTPGQGTHVAVFFPAQRIELISSSGSESKPNGQSVNQNRKSFRRSLDKNDKRLSEVELSIK